MSIENPNIINELALAMHAGSWHRGWLLGQWQYSAHHSTKINSQQLGSILTSISQKLIPKKLWLNQPCDDVAGTMQVDGDITPICLRVNGEMRINDTDWEEFTFMLRTPFDEFRGIHHIIHHGEEIRLGSLPLFASGLKLGKLIPLKINSFSIGLQYYESRHTIFLGYNPTPTAELEITADKDQLSMQFTIEQQKTKDSNIVRNHAAVQGLMHLNQ